MMTPPQSPRSLPSLLRPSLALALFLGGIGPAAADNTVLFGKNSALFASHASSIDNANTEPRGQLDAEYDLTYAGTSRSDYFENPLSLTYGLLPRWDATLSLGGEWQAARLTNGTTQTYYGLGDMPLNNKVKLLDQEQFWAVQSVEFAVKMPVASKGLGTGHPDFDLTWLATRALNQTFTVDFNLGYTWMGQGLSGPLSDQFHYGLALEAQATQKLTLVGQVFTAAPGGDLGKTEVAGALCFSWRFTPHCAAHGGVVKGFDSKAIGIGGTFGIIWTFGPPATPPSVNNN